MLELEHRLSIDHISISLHDNIDAVSDHWRQYENGDLMFSVEFLKAIEEYPPSDMDFRYGLFKKDEKVIGVAYYQIRLITLAESLRLDKNNPSIFDKFKSWLSRSFKSYTLISGNALVTGDYGIRFDASITDEQIFKIQDEASVIASRHYHPKKKVKVSFMKDFYEHQRPSENLLASSAYSQFSVQPNMIMKLDSSWNNFDDYLAALKSKYRVRVKRAKKLFGTLDKRELTLDDIQLYSKKIYSLYLSTAEQAGFNLFYLHPLYFEGMKIHFGDIFKVYGYFDGDQMLAFFTTFNNGKNLEAHFLGYDPNRNAEHQLYLNMLYDLIHVSLKNGHEIIHLSRTALEIKSSIGATPVDMYIYLTHHNKLINKYVPKALDYFVPQEEWLPREPFK